MLLPVHKNTCHMPDFDQEFYLSEHRKSFVRTSLAGTCFLPEVLNCMNLRDNSIT